MAGKVLGLRKIQNQEMALELLIDFTACGCVEREHRKDCIFDYRIAIEVTHKRGAIRSSSCWS
jgi:hypothetical protein